MPFIQFKVTQRNRVAELRQSLRPRAGRTINAWARNVLAISQQLVNVGDRRYVDPDGNPHPGFLKKSGRIIDYANTAGDGRQSGVAKSVGYFAPYAKWVHDGNGHYAGNPFLLAAFEACRDQLTQDLASIFDLNK
jgi:hypothetical protein